MTDAEKAALAWLDGALFDERNDSTATTLVRTLKAMLAEPRLPKEPRELVTVMLAAWRAAEGYGDVGRMGAAIAALYAHLTAPVDDLEEIRRYGT